MRLKNVKHLIKFNTPAIFQKFLFFLFCPVITLCFALGKVGANSALRPNLLFLAVDDLRPELGAYGSKIKTPNMDRLASKGTLFERAYCQQAVCGASRLSIMSGLYPTLTKEQTYHVENWRKRHPDLLTLNQHFKEQGYQTIGLGKIYHGKAGAGVDPKNWSQWIKVDSSGHYLRKKNIDLLRKAQDETKISDPKDPPKGPMTESADVPDHAYLDGKRADRAVQVIRELSRSSNRPFFLAVGLSKPHLPFCAPKKYWDLYDRNQFKMPPNKEIPPGYPSHAANLKAMEMRKYSDYEGKGPREFSDATNRRLLHGYAAATSYVDACVGKVLDSLRNSGLEKNTIVVLWGDHGWKLGDHSSWCKHTNFECDTRVPLIIFDPREQGGKKTSRLVELIDLYPTLCDLVGLPIPNHCQGRSFRKLIKDPEVGHRYDAYSSYPAYESTGHSIRFKNYRYTEWRDIHGVVKANVLTDLTADPGEETNVKDSKSYVAALAYAKERLQVRINQALESSYAKKNEKSLPPVVSLALDHQKIGQKIRGFGGSIAFWGTNPSDEAMEYAFKELGTSILRVQGEVKKNGNSEHSRDVLQRAMKNNPDLEVLLTFWQPRSPQLLKVSDWLDIFDWRGERAYRLKYSMEDAWAEEIVRRTRQHMEWGINVTTLGVQNETNYSNLGSQTCIWDPQRLRNFIDKKLFPRLREAGLSVKIAAPDLAYIGYQGSELSRFLPTINSKAVDVVAYHMYDSYKDGMDGSLSILRENSRKIGQIRRENFPKKEFWMTETTGAQWNNDIWHTYGWMPELTEFDKAILAAQYAHMTLADAQANVFMWWGLVYSLAPDRVKDPKVRQKHRDEGLVLVEEKPGPSGRQELVERTKKFFMIKQYSGFITDDFRKVSINSPDPLWVSAYFNSSKSSGVIVAINPSADSISLDVTLPEGMKTRGAYQTDKDLNCESVSADSPLPGRAVRTILYSANQSE